ncbi:zinc-finger associated domain (zf-AD) domain-containing protein [Phthorimaea operculella]|nr:zinc-finger associated domain (zf-AD) domain-containing protein [Phthorimaea operculella]
METQKNNGMCRCCASEGTFKDVKTSYQWMGEEEIYADMLRECLDISLCADVSGEVEGGICEVCITQLRNASNFKKQVLHTEEQFKQRIQDKLFKNEIVKVELSPQHEEDSDNDNVLDSTLDDDYSGTEYEVPVKTEVEEKPKKRGKAAKASTSRAKKLKKEDGESSKRKC